MQRASKKIRDRVSCFYLANSRQMQLVEYIDLYDTCCFYLANSRQMQHHIVDVKMNESCFYLANSRQMQLLCAKL